MAHHPHQSHRPEWSSPARTFSLHWQTSKLKMGCAGCGTLSNVADDGPNTTGFHITGTLDARPEKTTWIGGPETKIKLMRDQQVATASGAVEQFIQQLQLLLSVRVTEAKHTWV
jgi:hypothetical protein